MDQLIFFVNKVLISGSVLGSIYALGGYGGTLIFGILLFAHFPHGAMWTLGGLITFVLAGLVGVWGFGGWGCVVCVVVLCLVATCGGGDILVGRVSWWGGGVVGMCRVIGGANRALGCRDWTRCRDHDLSAGSRNAEAVPRR